MSVVVRFELQQNNQGLMQEKDKYMKVEHEHMCNDSLDHHPCRDIAQAYQ